MACTLNMHKSNLHKFELSSIGCLIYSIAMYFNILNALNHVCIINFFLYSNWPVLKCIVQKNQCKWLFLKKNTVNGASCTIYSIPFSLFSITISVYRKLQFGTETNICETNNKTHNTRITYSGRARPFTISYRK